MKKIAWLIAAATLVVAGGYSVVSLGRWEWTRALYFALVFLAAEVALSTGLILRRLGRAPGTGRSARDLDPQTLAILRANRPPRPNRFDWLDPVSGRMNVFITMLVGGGVLLSGIAWLVDKVASRTTTPAGEVALAKQLGSIRYPRGGLLVDDVTVLAQAVPGVEDPQLRKLLRRSGHGG